jgi:hypothetical protein
MPNSSPNLNSGTGTIRVRASWKAWFCASQDGYSCKDREYNAESLDVFASGGTPYLLIRIDTLIYTRSRASIGPGAIETNSSMNGEAKQAIKSDR